MTSQNWIDSFLLVDIFLVTVLVFLDWILGKEKRKKLQEQVEKLWVKIDDLPYSNMLPYSAYKALCFLKRLFGARWLSKRRIFAALLVAFILAFPPLLTAFFSPTLEYPRPAWLLAATSGAVIIPGALFFVASLSVTILLLHYMSNRNGVAIPIVLILFDLLCAITILLANIYWYSLVSIAFWGGGGTIYLPNETQAAMQYTLLTALLPSFIHLTYSFVTVIAKLLRGVLKGPINLILLRVTESEKGVLTQFAIGLGVTAKIVQQALKMNLPQ